MSIEYFKNIYNIFFLLIFLICICLYLYIIRKVNKEISKIKKFNFSLSIEKNRDFQMLITHIIVKENLDIVFKELHKDEIEPYFIFDKKNNCSKIYLNSEFYSSTCLFVIAPIIHELGHAYLYTKQWYTLYLEDVILIEEFLASYIGYKLLLKHNIINLSNSDYKFIKSQLIVSYLSYFFNISYWFISIYYLLKKLSILLFKKRPN